MSNNRSTGTLKSSLESALRNQVAGDIEAFLASYSDSKKALAILAKKTKIHSKTLRRLLQKNHSPGYQTLYKLYTGLLGAQNLNEILARAPVPVQEKLRRIDPQLKDDPSSLFSPTVEEELLKNPILAEMYVLADVGLLDRVLAKKRFGEYGLQVLRNMLELQILRAHADGKFSLGQNCSAFSAETIKKVGLHLGLNYLKPQKADVIYANHMTLFFEGLSEKTYREWIDIDVQSFKEKMACLSKPGAKGTIPAFTFSMVETLKETSDND